MTDAADSVAHLVETGLIKPQVAHLGLDALPDILQLTVHAGNGNNITHELNDVLVIGLNSFFYFLSCHISSQSKNIGVKL